jgi:hypothetical protein
MVAPLCSGMFLLKTRKIDWFLLQNSISENGEKENDLPVSKIDELVGFTENRFIFQKVKMEKKRKILACHLIILDTN